MYSGKAQHSRTEGSLCNYHRQSAISIRRLDVKGQFNLWMIFWFVCNLPFGGVRISGVLIPPCCCKAQTRTSIVHDAYSCSTRWDINNLYLYGRTNDAPHGHGGFRVLGAGIIWLTGVLPSGQKSAYCKISIRVQIYSVFGIYRGRWSKWKLIC